MLKYVTELYVYWFRSHIHERRLLASSCVAVHMYQRGLIGQFSMKFGIEYFYEKRSRKSRLI